MNNPSSVLADFPKSYPFFVGIDSDGCAFDTMELKHKQCFIPEFIRHFELEAVADEARAVAEFVSGPRKNCPGRRPTTSSSL